MLLRVFELKPGYSPYKGSGVIGPGNSGSNYTFIVGTRAKPTQRLRERIERAIAGAWEGIFDLQEINSAYNRDFTPPPYGVTLVPDSAPLMGETAPPKFAYNGFYIVFALLESDSAVSEEEEREITQDIARAIENQVREMIQKPRIGVVTLFNCSIQVLEGEGYR